MQKITKKVKQTYKLAKKFAKTLKGGDIVCLTGDLGSGKTVFAKGVAAALGIKAPVTSPTFTIYNEYHGKKYDLYHFDLYRLEDISEVTAIGADEIFANDAIKLVEWPDVAYDLLNDYYIIDIEKIDDNTRKITITRK